MALKMAKEAILAEFAGPGLLKMLKHVLANASARPASRAWCIHRPEITRPVSSHEHKVEVR